VYPPFKKGRYMEEYVYDYLSARQSTIDTDWVYLPVFWTNLQNHPGFQKEKYNLLLQQSIQAMSYEPSTRFVTVVQHDDGPQLTLPPNTTVFGACTGDIPLPLLYEDTDNTLLKCPLQPKSLLASFVGQATHPIRRAMCEALKGRADVQLIIKEGWSPSIPKEDAESFMEQTMRSRFCLAPRGYGRSSFRFFEAMQLNTVPVYLWDDKEWLPYKEELDYTRFSVSVSKQDVPRLIEILESIPEEKYQRMQWELQKVRRWFTLEGMADYILRFLRKRTF